MKEGLKIKFWGVRGSVVAPGVSTTRYGGNTSCVEAKCGKDSYIFDAGTGLRILGNELINGSTTEIKIFLSHFHWDHTSGFPFFRPAYSERFNITLYGESKLSHSFEELFSTQLASPYFPVSLKQMAAKIVFKEIKEGDVIESGDVRIRTVRLNHPNGCLGFRVEYKGKSFVYATDTEHFNNRIDPSLLKIARGTDLIIYDSHYTEEEYYGKVGFSHVGWGHSTWKEGIRLANEAGVKKFILFHHDPDHDDNFISAMEKEAQRAFKGMVSAAYEGMEIEL